MVLQQIFRCILEMKIKTLKTCLKVFTVFFTITGVALICMSAYVLTDVAHTKHISYNVQAPAVIMAVVGIVIFFLASIGFIGILNESPPYLLTYVIGLSGIALMELYVAFTTGVRYRKIDWYLKDDLAISLTNYYDDEYDRTFWDDFQTSRACCGIYGYYDWKVEDLPFPQSCCQEKIDENVHANHKMCANFLNKHLYKNGCHKIILQLLKADQKHLCIFAIIVSLAEIVGICLTWILLRRLKKSGSGLDAEDRFQEMSK